MDYREIMDRIHIIIYYNVYMYNRPFAVNSHVVLLFAICKWTSVLIPRREKKNGEQTFVLTRYLLLPNGLLTVISRNRVLPELTDSQWGRVLDRPTEKIRKLSQTCLNFCRFFAHATRRYFSASDWFWLKLRNSQWPYKWGYRRKRKRVRWRNR